MGYPHVETSEKQLLCNSPHILGEISWMPYFNHGANYRVMFELWLWPGGARSHGTKVGSIRAFGRWVRDGYCCSGSLLGLIQFLKFEG